MGLWGRFNPENNRATRAFLYTMGVAGYLHVISGLILSVSRADISYLNSFEMLTLDELIGIENNAASFVLGWLFWFLIVYVFYRVLSKSRSGDG